MSTVLTFIVPTASGTLDPISRDYIQIIKGEDITIYEYRNNGMLLMIKVVPGNPGVVTDGNIHNF